jgi:hypothetical protein
MEMQRSIVASVGATMMLAGVASAGPIQDRMLQQDERIDQGAASGELTPRETQRLDTEENAIAGMRNRALADGRIGPREAQRITAPRRIAPVEPFTV